MEKRNEKYINYSVADFVLDDDFIGWVKNPTAHQDKFWIKFSAENPSQDKNIAIAKLLISSIDSNIPKNDLVTKERVWEGIVEGYNTKKIIPINQNKFWMIAASVLAILMFGTYLMLNKIPAAEEDQPQAKNQPLKNDVAPGGNKAILQLADGSTIILDSANNGNIATQGQTKIIKIDGQLAYNSDGSSKEILYNIIATPRGGQYQLILADGSKVWLNAASSLRFPTNFVGKERSVTLTGEGYFEVAKNVDMPFKVDVAGKGEVEVLGTHFNVNAYEDEPTINTTLLEGAVKFSTNTAVKKEEVHLFPGQQARFKIAGQITVIKKADIESVMAWKNGNLIFQGEGLQYVMRQLERWYNIDVEYKGKISSEEFVGNISRDVNISKILKMLEATGSVKFEIVGRKVIVK